MTDTSTLPRLPTRPASLGRLTVAALVGIVIALGLWQAAPVFESPATVDLRIENPTEYDLHVRLRSSGGSLLGLGEVQARSTKRFDHVADQGELWTIEFSYAGTEAAVVQWARPDLETSDWRVPVPESAGAELAALGIEPST